MSEMRPLLQKRWDSSQLVSSKCQIARRGTDRLIPFVDVQLGMFSAIVHYHINHHAASAAGAVALSKNLVGLDNAPFAARSPVLLELIQWIPVVVLRMLFPLRIVKINAVGSLEVLLLQRREEFIGDVLFRPKAVVPANPSQN